MCKPYGCSPTNHCRITGLAEHSKSMAESKMALYLLMVTLNLESTLIAERNNEKRKISGADTGILKGGGGGGGGVQHEK